MNILTHIHAALIERASKRLNRSTTWDLSTLTQAEIRILKSK